MMNPILRALILTAAFGASTVLADMSENPLVPQREMDFAKGYLSKLREKNYDFIRAHLDPQLDKEVSDAKLDEIVGYFPTGDLLSEELIGSQVNINNGLWQGNFTFEYEFESGWALANVVIQRKGEVEHVVGFNVYRTEGPQRELNKFGVCGKSALHYAVLIMACVVPLFILTTLVFCIRTPMPKRKWLWVIFILFGVGTISLNWTTGAYQVQLIYFMLLGAGFMSPAWGGALVLKVAFPLGAVLFWVKRKKFITQSQESESNESADDSASE